MELNIHFSWWEQVIIWLFPFTLFFNTLTGLLTAFRSRWLLHPARWRSILLYVFYFAELAFLPLLIYMAITEIRDNFFPPEPGFLDTLFKSYLPVNQQAETFKKVQTIDLAAGCLCSLGLLFLFHFSV